MRVIELSRATRPLIFGSFLCIIAIVCITQTVFAQSASISYPTPLYNNEVSGTIRARDIGDPRLTSYFYTFQGNQGDVFMNVVTKNFNGDVDVFLTEGLKPLTKVVVYAETAESETGRVLYLRKPEKLILRIEGRSPNDDPATFQIKFAGSFEASKDPIPEGAELPKVENVADSNIRVNSVGTILAVIPKTKPTPVESVAKKPEEKPEIETTSSGKPDETVEPAAPQDSTKTEVVITENIPSAAEKVTTKRAPSARTRGRRNVPPRNPAPPETSEAVTPETLPPAETKARPSNVPSRAARKAPLKNVPPDPLANIHLVIEFKDGSRIERPMNEVIRFSVDRGILTVIAKDGTIGRYPILDVSRTTIQ